MNRRVVAAFARRFRQALERDGIAALQRFDWSGGFFGLGFEMDCGHPYEEAYGFRFGDANGIGDLADAAWIVAALKRLEGLCGRAVGSAEDEWAGVEVAFARGDGLSAGSALGTADAWPRLAASLSAARPGRLTGCVRMTRRE